jgi:hypothetical protein
MEFDHHEQTSLGMTSVKLAMRGFLLFTRTTFLSNKNTEVGKAPLFIVDVGIGSNLHPRVADPGSVLFWEAESAYGIGSTKSWVRIRI